MTTRNNRVRLGCMAWWCVLGLVPAPGLRAGAQQEMRSGAEDRQAFRAARATVDPEERLKALRQFALSYPESALRPKATELALDALLRSFPGRTEAIHELATQQIADAPAGLERTMERARVADALASAEPGGADLPDAHAWAEEALAGLTEVSFRKEMVAEQRRYKLPALSAREMHRDFERDRVLCLAALANAELRGAKPLEAEPLLREAFRLEPLSSEVNRLRGELALDRNEKAAALEDFERAEATGGLPENLRAKALQLYRAGGGDGSGVGGAGSGEAGSGEAGFEAKVDEMYAKLMPPVFTLPPRTLPAGGHTALLELFTGSGCEPCVAPDLAVESLLATYGRRDLVVLEYDENIPRPDPLTSPAAEARALVYRVGSTPEAFLDGESVPVAGSARSDVENVVVGFATEVEDAAAQPSSLRLALTGGQTGGEVEVHAVISLGAVSPAAGAAATVLSAKPVIHAALVQDGIRYSGENGVRFHRMVVRAMGPDTALRLGPGAEAQTAEAHFNLKTVANIQRTYLDAYEHGNDRFGEVRFRTKDLPLEPAQLGVVVWVQDRVTRAVLQTAFLAVPEDR